MTDCDLGDPSLLGILADPTLSGSVVTDQVLFAAKIVEAGISISVGTSQGVAGPPGPPGPAGPTFTGFGTIDYSDLDVGTPINLPPGEWVRLTRNTTPAAQNYNLPSGPWAGFVFWDGSLFHARAVGDIYLFKIEFTVTPTQRMSGLSFSIRPSDDVTFEFGPEPVVLSVDAGQTQNGSETFSEQVRSRFAAGGATLYAMSTTGATLTQFSPEITPLGHA